MHDRSHKNIISNASDHPIDLVVTWVDGSDPAWLAEKARYDGHTEGDNRVNRYRDWELLRYWFRGVEKYMPWIRYVYFVTWGHIPDWLDVRHPKLRVIRHEDFIPEEYLPTFNSHTIEWNLYRIEGLSENFIYSNDDVFFLKPMKKELFFKEGLPRDAAIESIMKYDKNGIGHIINNDLRVLNNHFDKAKVYKEHLKKWYSPIYGRKNLNNIYFRFIKFYAGFIDQHITLVFLRSTFKDIWKNESKEIKTTCSHRFRDMHDVSPWLARYWQFASGSFVPGKPDLGRFYIIGPQDEEIKSIITGQKNSMICLADDKADMTDAEFKKEKQFMISCFEHILPEQSRFEKYR